jgi:hypothetical protein
VGAEVVETEGEEERIAIVCLHEGEDAVEDDTSSLAVAVDGMMAAVYVEILVVPSDVVEENRAFEGYLTF